MGLFERKSNSVAALLHRFKAEAALHGPCEEGLEGLARCRTRKDLFRLAMAPGCVDFFMKSMLEGWGPSPDEVEETFGPFVNGGYTPRYTYGDKQADAQMWCKSKRVAIDDAVRWLVLVGCKGTVEIGEWQVVKIVTDCKCDIDLVCSDSSVVYVENYGGRISDLRKNAKIIDKV